jgi:Ca2+-binding EF-hand superfamily protein
LSEIQSACVGDCDGAGAVTVDEIVKGVNIALGQETTAMCAAFDRDGNGAVTVDELVSAVSNALEGCRMA